MPIFLPPVNAYLAGSMNYYDVIVVFNFLNYIFYCEVRIAFCTLGSVSDYMYFVTGLNTFVYTCTYNLFQLTVIPCAVQKINTLKFA